MFSLLMETKTNDCFIDVIFSCYELVRQGRTSTQGLA